MYQKKSLVEKQKEVEQVMESIEHRLENILQSPESVREYLRYMSKFHRYSASNSLLIQMQFFGAQAVGSYAFWKKQGYTIRKGEKGLKILVPNKLRPQFQDENGKWKSLDEATIDQQKKIGKGILKQHEGKLRYSIGHVFDASQTNMKTEDLPKLFPNKWLEGEVQKYQLMYAGMEKVADSIDVKIVEPKNELGAAKGVSYPFSKEVALNQRNSELQNVKTLLHELAHAKLHTKETRDNYTAAEKEFQAEMVALTICNHLGLDTSDYSLSYLHGWTEGKKFEDHKRLLKEVRNTAVHFIEVLDQVLEQEKVKEQHQELANSEEKELSEEKQKKEWVSEKESTGKTNRVTEEEIGQAMKVDLVEYLQNKGESFIKQGKYYRHSKHDSLVIKDNMYAWNSKNEKGNSPITFVRLFYGRGFVEAVQDLNQSGAFLHSERPPKAPKEPFSYEKEVTESDTTKHLVQYLTKKRGIDSRIVQRLIQEGYVAEDERRNIVFKWKSPDGDIVGCDRQGTIPLKNPNFKHSTFKKIEANSKENYGFNVTLGSPKKLYFFESPIDLASYWSLKQKELKDCRLISMNGVKPETVVQFIRDQAKKKNSIEQVVLCVDNDQGGKEFIDKMSYHLDNDRLKVDIPKVCKDWNDVLKRLEMKKKKLEMSR